MLTSLVRVTCVIALMAVPALAGDHLCVDAFGYRPLAAKIAVLREAVSGFDAPDPYVPGPVIEVLRVADSSVAWSGTASAWNGGVVDASSGDRVWWLDFSALQAPGEYRLHDPSNGEVSEAFRIGADVYEEALRAAARMFLHQRCGTPKSPPFVNAAWADPLPCHVGPDQDLACLFVLNPVPATARDLSGGWHDAGDHNKYVNWADDALHALLRAYELDPDRWADDLDLPESGNGVPDLLDEIRWELEWLLKMQESDGSFLHKLSVTDFTSGSPPSSDTAPRRYAPPTASATISGCGACARGARAARNAAEELVGPAAADWHDFADRLQAAATDAWGWLDSNPNQIPSSYDNVGFLNPSSEDEPYAQEMNRVRAAVHLFRLTDQSTYATFVDAGYTAAHLFQWWWASPWEHPWEEALLTYADTLGSNAIVAQAIRDQFETVVSGTLLSNVLTGVDPYRAHLALGDYTWGSNRTKSRQGALYAEMNRHGLRVGNARTWLTAAEDHLHDLHGVNPLGLCFLTNMGAAGAERSCSEMYHGWFHDGTIWDSAISSPFGPPPGYVTGGPNPTYTPDAAYVGPPIVPPELQPARKSYRDWNTSWPENSWEVTEPHIPYQAAYVRLLAEIAVGTPVTLGLAVDPGVTVGQTTSVTVGGVDPGELVVVMWGLAPGHFTFAGGGWAVDFGLELVLDPLAHVLFLGPATGAGTASWPLTLPAVAAGLDLHLQAGQGGTAPWPVQSALVVRRVE